MTDSEVRVEAETYLYALASSMLLSADAVWPHIEPGVLTAEETQELRQLCDGIQSIGVRVMGIGRDVQSRSAPR